MELSAAEQGEHEAQAEADLAPDSEGVEPTPTPFKVGDRVRVLPGAYQWSKAPAGTLCMIDGELDDEGEHRVEVLGVSPVERVWFPPVALEHAIETEEQPCERIPRPEIYPSPPAEPETPAKRITLTAAEAAFHALLTQQIVQTIKEAEAEREAILERRKVDVSAFLAELWRVLCQDHPELEGLDPETTQMSNEGGTVVLDYSEARPLEAPEAGGGE